jgi:hypothetical protein
MSVVRHQLIQVFADYNQFYVQDGGVNPPAPEDWTEHDIANRSKVAENIVVVCPLRNMIVPVEMALHDAEPSPERVSPDHVVDCSLSLPSGHLQIHECTGGSVLNWEIAAGTYRVRLVYFNLDTITSDGLEGADFYKVELWLGQPKELSVSRSWPNEA